MRRKAAPKRKILPDPMYKSEVLAKFMNNIMLDGKKTVAERIVYGALNLMSERLAKEKQSDNGDDGEGGVYDGSGQLDVIATFERILQKVKPPVEVRSRRVGGATYQVPVEVDKRRGMALSMRWVIESARKRGEKSMTLRLAGEFVDALHGRGGAIKKSDEVVRMAKANQAFAHFRW